MTYYPVAFLALLAVTSVTASSWSQFGPITARHSWSRESETGSRMWSAAPGETDRGARGLAAAVAATDSPPAFGTVMQQWSLPMSGVYAGAGITWRRDSGRFYLCDLRRQVWSLCPEDPTATIRRENWLFPNLGGGAADIPWSIAWDQDSGCFWFSSILDGSIYNGCYYIRMRRTPVGDTWRWFPENPGDTWLVGDGSGGGAGGMYWMAGSDKWLGRSYFACAPVAPSPNTNNYVWRFDPYTKTSLGRCDSGSLSSERGCGLVPWDSNYIITTGPSLQAHYLRDSNGAVLRSAPATIYAPADLALWVPATPRPADTVFMYCMCSNTDNTLQKISVGLLWSQLPSVIPPNVRTRAIAAPVGAVDSGLRIVPRLVVENTGTVPADSFNVWFTIRSEGATVYCDSLRDLYLGVLDRETVAFTPWVLSGRDSMSATAWACWAGDSFPKDDTVRSRFFARVTDVAVTEIPLPAPDTVLDSGVVIYPQCRLWNYGNVPTSFDVRFDIGSYQSTRAVSIVPGGAKLVAAQDPYTTEPGTWTCRAFADVPNDLHPEDNTRLDTFYVVTTGVTDGSFIVLRSSFLVSPNPCRDFVLLSFTGPLDHMTTRPLSLSLYNSSGRLVLRQSAICNLQSEMRLDLRSLPDGVYVLRYYVGTFTGSQKIVLQH